MAAAGVRIEHGNFVIRNYRPGDEAELNDGFNQVFRQSRELAEWHRKFHGPDLGRRILVAEDRNGKIVAQYSATTSMFQVAGRKYLAGQLVDIFALRRPDVVMSRVFARTVAAFFDELCGPGRIALLYGFPGERHLRLGQLKSLYQRFKRVLVWTRPVLQKPSPEVARIFGNKAERAQIDAFWRRTAKLTPGANRRDLHRLDDRFFADVGRDYKFVTHARGGLLHAWAVFSIRGTTVSVAELMWDGESPLSLQAVTDRIEIEAALAGAGILEAWAPLNSHIADALAAQGWQSSEHAGGAFVALKSFDPAIDDAWLLDNLFYSMGDTDLV